MESVERLKKMWSKHFKKISWVSIILAFILFILPQIGYFMSLKEYQMLILLILVIIHLEYLVHTIFRIDEKLEKPCDVSSHHNYYG